MNLRKFLALGLNLAALGLAACDRESPSPTSPEAAGSGSARIALPELPAGYLADPSQRAFFSLVITGPGNDTLRRSAYLLPGGAGHDLTVDGIPAGPTRFLGTLYRTDSAGGTGAPTHTGTDSAVIRPGQTAQVHLFLRKYTGSANVCVEVEGWPSDPACLPKPKPIDVGGCYALQVKANGSDTVIRATLRILQKDTSLFGTIAWPWGLTDTATGILRWDGVVYLGWQGRADFVFKADVDSSGRLSGWFRDGSLGIDGNAQAFPGACGIAPPPPKPSARFDSVLCWNVAQKTLDGRDMQGTLWAGWAGDSLRAWFKWEGYIGFYMDNETAPAHDGTLYLFGVLQGGFAHPDRDAIENGHYKARLTASGRLETGAAYAHPGVGGFTSGDGFADWSGSPYACPDEARTTLGWFIKLKIDPIKIYINDQETGAGIVPPAP